MFIGRVVGQVWATRKMRDLEGKRLLVVQPLDDHDEPGNSKVSPVVCADPLGANQGEAVLVAFGKAARVAMGGDGDYALEAAVVGIVDDIDAPNAPASWQDSTHAGRTVAHMTGTGDTGPDHATEASP